MILKFASSKIFWTRCVAIRRNLSACTNSRIKQNWPKFKVLPSEEIAPLEPVQLAGRQYLPGSDKGGFPDFLSEPKEGLPLVIQVKSPESQSLEDWAQYTREFIDVILPQSPAVVIKGLPFNEEAHISSLIGGLGYKLMQYVGGTSSRDVVDPNLNTASKDPSIFSIEPHNEMSYSTEFPSKVIFSCSIPPKISGESTLTDVRDVTRSLNPKMIKKLIDKGISYMSFLPTKGETTYTSWQERLLTENNQEAEKALKELGHSFYWHSDGGLSYWYKMPALIDDPLTGEKLFFNQAASAHSSYYKSSPVFENQDLPDDRYPCHCRYGDGTEIELEVLQHIRSVSWECSVGFRWEYGDVLVMDNQYIQHGRMGFHGDRRILATLTRN